MIEHLAPGQAARVRKAYREAFGANDYGAALRDFWTKYEAFYGVSRETLRQLVDLDRSRHRDLYQAIAKQRNRRIKADAKRSRIERAAATGGSSTFCPVCHVNFHTNFMPPHGAGRGCKGSGKFGISQAAVARERRTKGREARDHRSASVRAVQGGLPTLGRRG